MIQLPIDDHILDYQWSWNYRNLAKTYNDMVFIFVDGFVESELKEAVIEHHKNMIDIIKHTPRMYGRGVNWELVKLLTNEIEILQKPNSTLRQLRQIEEAKFGNQLQEDLEESVMEKFEINLAFSHMRSMIKNNLPGEGYEWTSA